MKFMFFFYKISFYWKIHKLHLFCWLNFSDNQNNRLTNRLQNASSSLQNAFWYIVLRVILLIYTRAMIQFSIVADFPECLVSCGSCRLWLFLTVQVDRQCVIVTLPGINMQTDHCLLTLCIIENPLTCTLTTVKAQMQYIIMLHFIWVCTVCVDYNDHQGQNYIVDFRNFYLCQFKTINGQSNSMLILSICLGKSIRTKKGTVLPAKSDSDVVFCLQW